jgi:PiT family inorganic phosphate transporter
MGIVWMLLIASGHVASKDPLPFWVAVACYSAIAAERCSVAGDRQDDGAAHNQAQAGRRLLRRDGGAMTLFLATWLGIPVSTTHTITGAIVGVGSVQRVSAVRWGVAAISSGLVLTIPASAFIAAVAWWLGRLVL